MGGSRHDQTIELVDAQRLHDERLAKSRPSTWDWPELGEEPAVCFGDVGWLDRLAARLREPDVELLDWPLEFQRLGEGMTAARPRSALAAPGLLRHVRLLQRVSRHSLSSSGTRHSRLLLAVFVM